MHIEVKLFSHLRLELGRSLTVEVPDDATVAVVMDHLGTLASSELESMILDRERGGYRLVALVNGRRTTPEAPLTDGDVVSLLPPLGGG